MPKNTVANDSVKATLRRWRVMEIEAKNGTRTRHVLGHNVTSNSGCASSAIKEFNLDTMLVTTRSGSLYKLIGLPGNSRIGNGAWNKWCTENGVVAELDVTTEYFNVDHASTLDLTRIKKSLLLDNP